MNIPRENTKADLITIPGKVVKYVRRGAKAELGHSLAIYEIAIHSDRIDPKAYAIAAARLDAARSLFEAVGPSDDPRQEDIQLDLRRWPRLLLRVLDEQLDAEVRRLQDAAAEGFELPVREVPALRALTAEVRKRTGAPPRRRRSHSFLERSRAKRRRRWRPRDHG